MYPSQLKIVNISSKGFKKQLLISSKEVATLYSFLRQVIKGKVMVINTNIGVDIYYQSPLVYDDLIVDTFLLLSTCKGKLVGDFHIKALNSREDIEAETVKIFEKLVKNPLLFKSYSKSLFNQLKKEYGHNRELIEELIGLWQHKIPEMLLQNEVRYILMPQIANLQVLNGDSAGTSLLKQLIEETLSSIRCN